MKGFEWELVERVTVAGPTPNCKRHRAFPSATRLHDGSILVAYREGTDHWITPDGVVRSVRSTDDGHTWSAPETLISVPERSLSCHLGMRELTDGTLLLPMVEGHRITGSPPYFRYYERMLNSSHILRSTDGGKSWVGTQQLDLGSRVIWNGCYGDVLMGREGEAVMCAAWQEEGDTHYRTGLLRSWDGGRSWGHLTQIAQGVDDEKSVCVMASGRWVAVMRDWERPSKLSFSDDGGHTWTPVRSLPFHGQCPSLLQTQSGVLLCSYRQIARGKPRGVGLAYSYDAGETWAETEPLYVAPQNFWDCAYANLLEVKPGEYVAIYYTAALGTEITDDTPEHPRYGDADNSIELVRFRQRE